MDFFNWIHSPEAWIALGTLTVLEIVLGIDNIIFITILVGKLPAEQRQRGRVLGLGIAMVTRIALLLCLSWIMHAEGTLFTVGHVDAENEAVAERLIKDKTLIDTTTDPVELKSFRKAQKVQWRLISWRDIILLLGGLFLVFKSTREIHQSLEGSEDETQSASGSNFLLVIAQIAVIDIIFSLDSVITAVGMAEHVPVMIIAIMIAVGIMMLFAKAIGDFVENRPTIKMLALSFLILVGVALLGEGLEFHIPKGYIYFAMAFSVIVEMLNLKLRSHRERTLRLHQVFPGSN